jgi:hypothetical protein
MFYEKCLTEVKTFPELEYLRGNMACMCFALALTHDEKFVQSCGFSGIVSILHHAWFLFLCVDKTFKQSCHIFQTFIITKKIDKVYGAGKMYTIVLSGKDIQDV